MKSETQTLSPRINKLTKRVLGYDISKAVAMFLVVLLHSSFYVGTIPNNLLTRALMTSTVIGVPLFITTNGAILLNKPLDIRKHCKKIVRILFILYSWRAIHILVYRALGAPAVNVKSAIKMIMGDTNYQGYPMGHFWFLEALVAIYIVFPLIKTIFDTNNQRPLILALGAIGVLTFGLDSLRALLEACLGTTGTQISSALGFLAKMNIFGPYGYLLIYFVAGGLLGKHYQAKGSRLETRNIFTCLMILSISLVCTVSLHEAQFIRGIAGPYTTTYGYWLITTLTTTLSIFYLAVVLGNTVKDTRVASITKFLGSKTLGVYLMHMFGLIALSKIISLVRMPPPHFTNNIIPFKFSGSVFNTDSIICCR